MLVEKINIREILRATKTFAAPGAATRWIRIEMVVHSVTFRVRL